MNTEKSKWLRRMWNAGFSPSGFLVRAALIAVFFAACHFAGWREHTSFLSGTPSSSGGSAHASAVLGLVYMAGYFGFVLLAPILTLSAGLLFIIERWTSPRSSKP